ncbi:MAG: cytochrome c biogenesis protein CcsA [Gammaproteobacteria bacterium]|nr:cytochrome c biogenesis protein CcsA [Gammaproteobacteria bacterium]
MTTMTSFYIVLLTILFYFIASGLIAYRLKISAHRQPKTVILVISLIALTLHLYSLSNDIITTAGFNLSLFNTLSASMLIISLLTITAFLMRPLELFAMLVLPVSASSLLLAWMFPSSRLLPLDSPAGLKIHVLISIIAYSLMALATLHAIFLSVQNRHLHNHQTGGIIRLLPPLQEMEKLLFEIILVGFVLLSAALSSGFIFLENLFQQHLVHKTLLSILAWFLYAVLLLGHWLLGWRGRTAVRWTIGGFACLMLAYIGSKFVLEFILQ